MPNRNRVEDVVGFHIDRGNGTVRTPRGSGERIPIVVGRTYKALGRLKMCETGCHASMTIAEASKFRFLKPGRTISLVEVWGDVRVGQNKVVGRYRKVLATIKVPDRIKLVEKTVESYDEYGGDPQKVTFKVVDPDWLASLEEKLHAQYKQNKRAVDADETVVELPA
ncbi:MAG TPA: hypothetical protein VIV60_07490 [Polyangiaceae bacterium]